VKSYFLAPIASRDAAIAALSAALPRESETWLLKDAAGDAIAYFSLDESDSTTGLRTISADVSGRHYHRDADVLSVLHKLKTDLGGEITNDA
jgi:hypothetical protein